MIEAAAIQLLLADGGVSALVGNRVEPGMRSQALQLPAINLRWVEGAPIYSNNGDSGLNEVRLEIDCWGETYTAAKDVGNAVKAVFTGFVGSQSGLSIEHAMIDSERDFRETGASAESYYFRTNIDVIFWYR